MKKLILLTACLFCIALASCNVTENEDDKKIFGSPDQKTPVSGGIIVTGESTPDELKIWGDPVNPSEWMAEGAKPGKWGLWLESPFPNPANQSTRIHFQFPNPMHISIYIVPARFSGSAGNESNLFAGGYFMFRQQGISIKLLVDNDLQPGSYIFTWDLTDDSSNPVAAGFYRVYMKAGKNLMWRDIYVYRQKEDLPEGLR